MNLHMRPSARTWRGAFLVSVILHGLAAWLVPGSWVRWGRGDAGDSADGGASTRWVPFAALDPIEVVRLAPVPVTESAEPVTEPPAEVPASAAESSSTPPTPAEIEALLRRSLDAGPPAASSLRSGGAGAVTDPSRPPVPLAFRWPEYPRGAERADGPVTVEIRVWVGADGTPGATEVAATSGIPALDEKAREVASGIRFEPAVRNGRAVASWYRLPITFHP